MKLADAVEYRGFLQPDRWKLHPEDFAVRMAWERDRQRILDAQAEAEKKKLPYPQEKIPPIPKLLHPEYVVNPVAVMTTKTTEKTTEAAAVVIQMTTGPEPEIEPDEAEEDRDQRRRRLKTEWMRKKREKGSE